MLILDIPCQQFGDKCKLEGFFVPFGHRDGKCIFIEIYIVILDICCQQSHQSVISEATRVNTSITSISHIRNHQGQYINHINKWYQKPPGSIRQSHQSVITEITRVNTSITSISHIRNHQRKYINHINLLYEKAPESIHWSYQSVISEATRVNTSITSICHIRNHQSQYINHINQSYQTTPDNQLITRW